MSGVVICPPFGWDEECTYRARRVWAEALADAGHPTIRLQLPGTGDSVGALSGADRLASWKSAVTAASSWLRDEFGASRVCGLGIGFGGMLAWLTAADGAGIDDLVLWGTPPRGRRLVRELRAAAKLDIDFRGHAAGPDGDRNLGATDIDGGLLDEAGQAIPSEIIEALEAVDLLKTPLPDPERHRVLLLQRTGVKADQDLARHLSATGVAVTVEDGDSYGPMMRYVQHSVVPADAIARSLAWLSKGQCAADREAPEPGHPRPVMAAPDVVFTHEGARIRESAEEIQLSSGTLRAIITEPVDVEVADLSLVFFSGGADRRTGPNRLWVATARRWAARGVTSVRVDPAGVGDSEGDSRPWGELRTHYANVQVEYAAELLDVLQRRGVPARFALVGFCSGAFRGLHTAVRDHRVAGVVAIGLPFFHWTWWTVNVHDSWLAARQPKPEDSALKLKVVATIKRCLKALKAMHQGVVVLGQLNPNRGERLIKTVAGRGTQLVFVLKGPSYAYEQLHMPARRRRIQSVPGAKVIRLCGDDQRFRPLASQRLVSAAIDETLGGLITAPIDAAARH